MAGCSYNDEGPSCSTTGRGLTGVITEGSSYVEGVNYDEATLAQVEKIQREVRQASDYVSDKEELLPSLSKEYTDDDTVYQSKIKDLCKRYTHLRRLRGDGNCFFRAYAFGYMEKVLLEHLDISHLKKEVTDLKKEITTINKGYDYDEFHEVFIELLEMAARPGATVEQLLTSFRDPSTTDYAVCYLRILTSGYLQLNASFFQAFIDGGLTVKQYCTQEVDPMYHESDHIHITALTSALGIRIRVEYMDRGQSGLMNHHDFPECAAGSDPHIYLLYRPGHYDILYPSHPSC